MGKRPGLRAAQVDLGLLQRALKAVLDVNPALLPAHLHAPSRQAELLAGTQSGDRLRQLMAEHAELGSVLQKFQAIGPAHAPSAPAAPPGHGHGQIDGAASGFGPAQSGHASGSSRAGSAAQPRPGNGAAAAAHRAPAYHVRATLVRSHAGWRPVRARPR